MTQNRPKECFPTQIVYLSKVQSEEWGLGGRRDQIRHSYNFSCSFLGYWEELFFLTLSFVLEHLNS